MLSWEEKIDSVGTATVYPACASRSFEPRRRFVAPKPIIGPRHATPACGVAIVTQRRTLRSSFFAARIIISIATSPPIEWHTTSTDALFVESQTRAT